MVADTRFVNGAQKLAQRIRTIRGRLQIGPLTEEIGELLLARTLRRFDAEIDPDGKRWPELSHGHQERRARDGHSGKMLNVSGALRGSIQLIRGAVDFGTVYTNTGAGVRIGVEPGEQAMKAYVHNYGWKRKPGGPIQQRRFLGIGQLDVKSVDSFLRRRAQSVVDES
jgi:phage virion morphogenesis protein